MCAYYDCSCDSHGLFDDKEIARTEGDLAHLNQYHVISIDVSGFVSIAKKQYNGIGRVPELIEAKIYEELISLYPELRTKNSLSATTPPLAVGLLTLPDNTDYLSKVLFMLPI